MNKVCSVKRQTLNNKKKPCQYLWRVFLIEKREKRIFLFEKEKGVLLRGKF
jgi:hypothetical protein